MIRNLALALCVLAATACSTTSKLHQAPQLQPGQTYSYSFSNQSGDDPESIASLNAVVQARLREAGLLRAEAGDPKIEVVLKHYYVRSNGARFWAGIMAGRDKIVSNVRVLGPGGATIGNFDVETINVTAWGTSGGLMERHADEIVTRLKSS
jgi:hypothetical protein